MSFLPLIKILFLLLATNPLLYILYKINFSEKGLWWESGNELLESNSDTLTYELMHPENVCDGDIFNERSAEFQNYCSGRRTGNSDKTTPESEDVFQLEMKTEKHDSCNVLHAKPCCRMFFIATLLTLVLFQTLEYDSSDESSTEILEDVEERILKSSKPVPMPMLSFRRRIIPGSLGHLLQQKLDVHYIHEDYTLVSCSSS